MSWKKRVSVLGVALAAGCATATDDTLPVRTDAGKKDSTGEVLDDVGGAETAGDTGAGSDAKDGGATDTGVPPGDTGLPDTGLPDTGLPDTGLPDTGTPDSSPVDTGTPDTGPVDTGVTDTGTTFTALIFTDVTWDLVQPDDAVTALGGTAVLSTSADFNTKFDAKGFDVLIIDAISVALPTGVDTRISSWVAGGGRLVFAYWSLATNATLAASLGVTVTTSFSTILPVYKDPTSLVDLFAGPKQTLPSPLIGTDTAGVDGDHITVAKGDFLAARFTSATGTGAIAVTKLGKVIVNAFAPYEFNTVDADSDGKPDMRELYENEITYVRSK